MSSFVPNNLLKIKGYVVWWAGVKKSRKGLSNAVSALILVVASVIIALIVVGFAFGLIGAFTAQPVIHVVYAYVQNHHLYVVLQNTGNVPAMIVAYIIDGEGPNSTNIQVPVGTVTISIPLPSSLSLSSGQFVDFTLIISNGEVIPGVATVEC
ncbi:hypothetical protein [Betalipothrixvirus acidiani]|uniref:CARDB domain-containing protein n=1 Tax=Betalipothrixvirus acidiani TaxID=346881 RepID=A7WKA6_9VIRU|nr:hypothetical protein AFV3_gp17 [Acidianus filamentous virus 3]CAJ31507.1 hypothetical protein [Acidianus filamentous virus 3]